jgi:hypothetical protein
MQVVACQRHLVRGFVTALALVVLSPPPAVAQSWYRDASGEVLGSPPETPAELLEFCVANPRHCSISVNHLSAGWQRHLQADRLNAIASTYKLVTLLVYAQRVADGRTQATRRLSRDHWARFWIGADGEELRPTRTGPVVDEGGGTYQISRAGGRRLSGSLRRSWEYLRRPPRITLDDLAGVMIRFSDNAAADWMLYQFGERSFEHFIESRLSGFHDTPPSINAMFLTYFLNPEQPGRPAIGARMLSAYSGYETRGYRDEMARWFARLEDRRYVSQARSCQPAVLPWDQRIGACPPLLGEPGEEQMRQLFNRYSVQSNTRTQTRLMTRLLKRDLLDPEVHQVAERALEFRLDPGRFRDPRFRNLFRRYGAKSGSLRTHRGLSVLAWTAYFESQPGADGTTRRGAVSIHLRDLPGRQRDPKGGYSTPDIDFELPLRFAEDVILNRNGLATAVMNRLPVEDPRAELVARVRRLETRSHGSDRARALAMEVRVRNIGTAATRVATDLALFLRTAPGGAVDAGVRPADKTLPIPRLAPGESLDLLFDIPVPAGRDFISLVVDPGDLVMESTESGHHEANNNVQWQRLRFATTNYRSIGTRRSSLATGDGLLWRATGSDGRVEIRFQGPGELPANIGRGDRVVLAPGQANEAVGYVDSRDGPDRLSLQQPLGVSLTGVAFTIRRAFHNIQSWEDARQGDLVAEQRVEMGILYSDGPFRCRPAADSGCQFDRDRATAMATIDGSVTNAAHYMALAVAKGQRHRARSGTGVVLDGEHAVKHGIRILDHYTRVTGLAMQGFGGAKGAAAISVERARHVLLDGLLIHDFDAAQGPVAGILGGRLSDFTLRNSIIYDGGGAGVRIDRPTASALVQNSTVFGMSGAGIREGDGLLEVRNTISMGNGEEDFQVRRGTQDHNLSSDGTASGPESISDRTPARQFRSLVAEARDLHLRSGADAAGAGIVLYPAFRTDIDGERRPIGPSSSWSIGADQ